MKILYFLLVVLMHPSFVFADQKKQAGSIKPLQVSIVSLLANPEKYNGKYIHVRGYFIDNRVEGGYYGYWLSLFNDGIYYPDVIALRFSWPWDSLSSGQIYDVSGLFKYCDRQAGNCQFSVFEPFIVDGEQYYNIFGKSSYEM